MHTLTGVFLFSIFGAVAVLLDLGIRRIEQAGISAYVLFGLRSLEAFLFAVDSLCIVLFVVAETWAFMRDVLHSALGGRDD